jgi:hypothetical protein
MAIQQNYYIICCMANEMRGTSIDAKDFSMTDVVRRLLPRGHVIHGYSSANNTRMLMVLATRDYSDKAPLLGFGMDGNSERALGRALMTYAMRERDGLEYITETHYPASTQAQIQAGSNNSVFDRIVWGGSFKMFQEADQVIAWSGYSMEGSMAQPVQGTGVDALTAVEALANAWQMPDGRAAGLPAISLE